MQETIQCQGCGIHIQTEHKEKIGYTPKAALERETILCQRCFRLTHYNEVEKVSLSEDDYLQMVSHIQNEKGLIVHIVDIFDLEGSLVKSLHRIIGNNPILLVGNKMDLLPKSTNRRKVERWLQSTANEGGLKVIDTFLISSATGEGIETLAFQIDKYRKKQNVYIVGTTNAGKSTFINQLIHNSSGEKNVITTSYFPGTTLGFIRIPLDNHSHLIDTPGIINKKQIVHYISKEDLKRITPKKEVKARSYQLNSGQTLFFGGLGRLDFIKGEKQPFVCYFSNQLPIHRTKLEKADQLYETQIGQLLSPPSLDSISKLPSFEEKTYKVVEGNIDVVFPGLGWVRIKNRGATVRLFSPEGVSVSLRKSFI